MTSPFRRGKKERKRPLEIARNDIVAAEKFESDSVKCKSDFAPGSRRMAELFTSLAREALQEKIETSTQDDVKNRQMNDSETPARLCTDSTKLVDNFVADFPVKTERIDYASEMPTVFLANGKNL